jgi:arylsulfatase A-like enzyme
MLWRWPGRLAPRVAARQVFSLLDLAPTLCTVAGIAPPDHFVGQDLTPILRGERDATERPYAVVESQGGGAGLRFVDRVYGRPWRDAAARGFGDGAAFHYDLLADPYQLAPIAERDPASDELLAEWLAATPWMGEREAASAR